jgi:hypothetical protein
MKKQKVEIQIQETQDLEPEKETLISLFDNHEFNGFLFDHWTQTPREIIDTIKQKFIPFIDHDGSLFVPDKKQLEEINPTGTPYMWCSNEWTTKIGTVKKGENYFVYIINGINHRAKVITTKHDHHGYHGFFKPSLNEVYLAIPKEIITSADKIYVHTEYKYYVNSEDTHRGLTTILLPECFWGSQEEEEPKKNSKKEERKALLDALFDNHTFDENLFINWSQTPYKITETIRQKFIPYTIRNGAKYRPFMSALKNIHPVEDSYMRNQKNWQMHIRRKYIKYSFVTKHKKQFDGVFRPSLNEIYLAIPKEIITSVDRIYVNTTYLDQINNFYLGSTTILLPRDLFRTLSSS